MPNCTTTVAAAVARPSACVPDGWVVLSMTNTHHAPLQRLQYERVAHLGCFMTRVVSLCYGSVPDAFGACVYGPHVIASDYRRSQYVSLNWAKWPFFLDAFRAARHLLWIEADVLIMRNPFECCWTEVNERRRWVTRSDTRASARRATLPAVAGGAVRRGVGAARGAAQLRAAGDQLAAFGADDLRRPSCNFTNGRSPATLRQRAQGEAMRTRRRVSHLTAHILHIYR